MAKKKLKKDGHDTIKNNLGKSIPITYKCEPPKHREKWTEEMTDTYITTKEKVAYHYSDFPLHCFSPEKTAFFDESHFPLNENIYGHKEKEYKLIIPVETEVWEYGNEIRIQFSHRARRAIVAIEQRLDHILRGIVRSGLSGPNSDLHINRSLIGQR